jgi:hypothetical protein
VHELEQEAVLRMKMPVDTWPVVLDITPGNDRIDVQLYSFNEESGQWVREGQGWLESADGALFPESALDAIHDGTWSGAVFSVGLVTHFSYWNVDWPVEAHGCLTGRIVDAGGHPAVGATVSIAGNSYTGASTPFTVGADGRFCVDVMRSEGAAEDVDQDGTPGETHSVRLRVAYEGKLYDIGIHDTPLDQGTCGEDDCKDLGDLALDASKLLQAAVCTISGRVVDNRGNPIPGAWIWGDDPSLDDAMTEALCGEMWQNCDFFGVSSDEDGSFSIRAPFVDALTVGGFAGWEPEENYSSWRTGQRTFVVCPEGAQNVVFDQGYDGVEAVVSVVGNTISWTPNATIELLYVTSTTAGYKWMISALDEDAGFAGPITYGVVPDGAEQIAPYDGAPPPAMEAGDVVNIMGWTSTPDGYGLWVTGEYPPSDDR